VGRVIRSKADYGMMIFADKRFVFVLPFLPLSNIIVCHQKVLRCFNTIELLKFSSFNFDLKCTMYSLYGTFVEIYEKKDQVS
jgi:hypothetical protein